MRTGNRCALWLTALLVIALPAGEAAAQRIEAVKGKAYKLTKKHGPWMIMVASFQEPPDEYKTDGMTPSEAADQLVYELRLKGIPAYTFSQQEVVSAIDAKDRMGRARGEAFVAQKGSVCVLAGNYRDPDESVAARTLKHVKKDFKPNFLTAEQKSGQFVGVLKSGGVYRKTPGRPTPLSGAFLTVNPLLSPEEIAQRQDDPLIARLNARSDYSLLQNPGKYTVVVASFYGQADIKPGRRKDVDEEKWVTSFLDAAADSAFELCKALRQGNFNTQSDPNQPPQLKKFDAYVFHDRYRSLVTVGSFDSPHDPEIKRINDTFRAKVRPGPNGKGSQLAAEIVTIPAVVKDQSQLQKRWWFDPQPALMEVPKLSH